MRKRLYLAGALAGMALGALVASSKTEYPVIDLEEAQTFQRRRPVAHVLDNGEIVYETKFDAYVGPVEKDPMAIIAASQYSRENFDTAFEVVKAIRDDERRAGALKHVVEHVRTMPGYGRTPVDFFYPPEPLPVDGPGWQAAPREAPQQSQAEQQAKLKGAIAKAKDHLSTSLELSRGMDDSLAKAELLFAIADNLEVLQEREQSKQAIREGLKSIRDSQPTVFGRLLAETLHLLAQAVVWVGGAFGLALVWIAQRLLSPTLESAGEGIKTYAQNFSAWLNSALHRQPNSLSNQRQIEESSARKPPL